MTLSIPTIDSDQWATRILRLFPRKWSSKAARKTGGVLWAVFKSLGLQMEITNQNLVYVFFATRILTATGEALDRVAADFFKAVYGYPQFVERAAGESDPSFRARIVQNLLMPGATRAAIIQMVTYFSGAAPRVIEPWRVQDTGAWDANSYWDVDTQDCPARFGNPALKYQAMIITQLPTIPGAKPFPFFAFDAASAWDQSFFLEATSDWMLTAARMDELINRTKVFGTTVWRDYNPKIQSLNPLASSYVIPEGNNSRDVVMFPAFNGPYSVMAVADWNCATAWSAKSSGAFKFKFSVPAPPGGGRVDWIAAPLRVSGFGQVAVRQDMTSFPLSRPGTFPKHNLFLSPSWNTTYWISSIDDSGATVQFSTPAPIAARLSYAWLPPALTGYEVIQPDTIQSVIAVPKGIKRYIALISPSWNTTFEISKNPTHLDVLFAQSPDAVHNLYWAIYPY